MPQHMSANIREHRSPKLYIHVNAAGDFAMQGDEFCEQAAEEVEAGRIYSQPSLDETSRLACRQKQSCVPLCRFFNTSSTHILPGLSLKPGIAFIAGAFDVLVLQGELLCEVPGQLLGRAESCVFFIL